jgi:TolB-like protein
MPIVLLAVLSAAPVDEVKIAAPGLTYVGISQQQGDLYLDYFANQVSKRGVHVITHGDITAVLGLERQKQLLGCTEESCVAELAGALGVRALLVGSIATAGSGFVVNLKVIESSGRAEALAVFSDRVANEEKLFEFLEASALELSRKLAPTPSAPSFLVPLTAGAIATVAGAVLFGVAKGLEGAVAKGDASLMSLVQARTQLQTAMGLQTSGFIVGSVGVGALVVAGVMALLGQAPPRVSFVLGSGGASVALSWGFP